MLLKQVTVTLQNRVASDSVETSDSHFKKIGWHFMLWRQMTATLNIGRHFMLLKQVTITLKNRVALDAVETSDSHFKKSGGTSCC